MRINIHASLLSSFIHTFPFVPSYFLSLLVFLFPLSILFLSFHLTFSLYLFFSFSPFSPIDCKGRSKVEVTLRLTVSQSVCLGIDHPSGTCDQILLPVGSLLPESCGHVSVGRSLRREDGSAVCSAITQWSESRRTLNHTLLSRLRHPQPGEPGSRIYIPQEQGGPVMPPDSLLSFFAK
jgi:hypothetical protein